MKKLYLLLFLVATASMLKAQEKDHPYIPLLDTNKVWIESYLLYKNDYQFYDYEITDTITYKDTLLYKIVRNGNNNETNYLRENTNERKVYFRNLLGEKERLLYDFSMQVGDYIDVLSEGRLLLHLDSIKNIEYLGKKRRTFYFSSDAVGNTIWVEGVGSLAGVLCPSLPFAEPFEIQLNCCYYNNDLFYQSEKASTYGCSYDLDNVPPILGSLKDNKDTVAINDKVLIYLTAYDFNYITPTITLISSSGNELYFSDFTYYEEASYSDEEYYYEASFDAFNNETGDWYVSQLSLKDRYSNITEKSYTFENSPVKFHVKSPIGVNEKVDNNLLKIFPNPVTDYIVINTENSNTKYQQVEIFDIYGRLLKKQTINSKNEKIDISSLKAGMYICKLTDDNKQTNNYKFIKK